ncbi:Exopolysaccharide synthesis protein [Candidatus Magnetoovum chiemensis]|nr:Exopolysaccharide synthesis protein [Candidatus Magnetoovum chiemensis]
MELAKRIVIDAITIEVYKEKTKILKNYLSKYKEELIKLPAISEDNAKVNLELSVNKDIYQKLLEYILQIEIAESMTMSDRILVEPAELPEEQKYPWNKLNYILGFILAVFWAFTVALFLEYIDDTIKDPDELKQTSKQPLLGSIPKTKVFKDIKNISNLPPTSPFVEAYRTIRNSLLFASIDKPVKTFLVTSSIEKEGKSSIASNLAVTFSAEDKNVLLLDLDLRRPSAHTFFNKTSAKGITNVLADTMTLDEAIEKTDIKGLDLLLSGPIPPDPSRLIESEKIKNIIEALKQKYSLIIIDTPPVVSVNDAVVIGKLVDGAVYVVEAGRASGSMVNHFVDAASKANINIFGLILNKFRPHASNYYHYYQHYRYYKK